MKVSELYKKSRPVGKYWRSIPFRCYVEGQNPLAFFIGRMTVPDNYYEVRLFGGDVVTVKGSDTVEVR